MGMIDGGTVGVGYVCGCKRNFEETTRRWVPKFCHNPEHRPYPCGCYNIAENMMLCTRHSLLRATAVTTAALLLAFGVFHLFF